MQVVVVCISYVFLYLYLVIKVMRALQTKPYAGEGAFAGIVKPGLLGRVRQQLGHATACLWLPCSLSFLCTMPCLHVQCLHH